jgi:hypothetical protein
MKIMKKKTVFSNEMLGKSNKNNRCWIVFANEGPGTFG